MSLQKKLVTICEQWAGARTEPYTGHPLAKLLRTELRQNVDAIVKQNFGSMFTVKASPGSGSWASVPWVAALDPRITTSTQRGIYVVYLFRADGSGVYLSLCCGTADLKSKFGTSLAKEKVKFIATKSRTIAPVLKKWNAKINLEPDSARSISYEWAIVGAKFYATDRIPTDNKLNSDLYEILEVYKQISLENIYTSIVDNQELETVTVDEKAKSAKVRRGKQNKRAKQRKVPQFTNLIFTRLPKPFILLAGISGTGKTRFVRQQAEKFGEVSKTYCLIPVRPDWHEPSDILGYVSRLNQSVEYVVTDVLLFLARAWREIFEMGLSLEVEQSQIHGERLVVHGAREALQSIRPFWLCLDEMNLAPVEQYFADYLAVIETRSWQWLEDEFSYFCEPLLKPAVIQSVDDKAKLRMMLGFDGTEYDEQWQLICQYGLSIPFNLIVAGTVNMDETTHGFSRKVIDRALSLDFGEFYPNDFDDIFESKNQNKVLSFPVLSSANRDDLPAIDSEGTKSITFLKSVNKVLAKTPFELAYRALNELLLAVITQNPQNDLELKAVWDDFMMYKVLPRIEGDVDKLAQQDVEQSVLVKLSQFLSKEFAQFWDKKQRPDLMREGLIEGDKRILVSCRSNVKLQQMQTQLVNCGYTSFWP